MRQNKSTEKPGATADKSAHNLTQRDRELAAQLLDMIEQRNLLLEACKAELECARAAINNAERSR